jgi:spore germination cell wall hydrolase CwlJ-like protein
MPHADALTADWPDEDIIAGTLWAECRGEPLLGQIAVAVTIAERARRGIRGSTLREVCLAPRQFSCWDDSLDAIDAARTLRGNAWLAARLIARIMQAGYLGTPVPGATHYHAEYVRPAWADSPLMTALGKIGRHLFYRED